VSRLDNPTSDAKLTADTLRDLGFTLIGGGAQRTSTQTGRGETQRHQT
jgi:hypothetical protein